MKLPMKATVFLVSSTIRPMSPGSIFQRSIVVLIQVLKSNFLFHFSYKTLLSWLLGLWRPFLKKCLTSCISYVFLIEEFLSLCCLIRKHSSATIPFLISFKLCKRKSDIQDTVNKKSPKLLDLRLCNFVHFISAQYLAKIRKHYHNQQRKVAQVVLSCAS